MNDLKRTLQDINRAANSLEIYSYSALSAMNGTLLGAYGTENATAYTQRRLDDVLMMLRELEQLHANLKQAMEVQP
ncbi:hypothetical protein [Thiothrix winogradskyi]|uniref:Uncharacterized protein n=1 Tax=Thiothrix winogradskyi TaxID=96472 RepID=A0ABY3SZH5_9GAMM|nr:hypothetical protein [Thiothrix winogradskyi]UJS23891.1 hypothetical protein L2Y54_18415 [Thiothrix winogradskyi]